MTATVRLHPRRAPESPAPQPGQPAKDGAGATFDRTIIDPVSPLHAPRSIAAQPAEKPAPSPISGDTDWWAHDKTVVMPLSGDAPIADDRTRVARPSGEAPAGADRTIAKTVRGDVPAAGECTQVNTLLDATPGADSMAALKPAATYVPLPAGFRLHEYRIDHVLGQGGFGIAYAATDVNLNAKVVIKEYFPEDFAYRSADNEVTARTGSDRSIYQSGLESFLVEARTLATFRHPHIVRVARFFEFHATAYMVLEYERGESFRAWRKSHPEVTERELVELLAPLLDGLDVVHATGFLHRDIKPDNIYVRDGDGTLVLLDFGAARHAAAAKAEDAANAVTPGYGPIEQFNDTDQGPWTDIYAMGATLFWLVTGKKTIAAPDRMVDPDPQPSAEELGKDRFSPEFLRAIDWALKVEPRDRPQSVAEFRSALFASNAAALGLQEALRKGDAATEAAAGADGLSLLKSPRLVARRIKEFGVALVQPRSWPIAVRMILAMVLAALLPMVITSYYNLQGTLKSVSSSELRNLEQFAQSTAGRISQLLSDSHSLANYLGTDSDFVGFLENVTDEGKLSIQSKLSGLVTANRDVQLAMVMNAGGTAVVSSDPAVMGKNFKFREYFRIAMEGRPHTTGIIVGSVAGAAGMFYSYPVITADRSKVLGAVVLRIKADPIYGILKQAETSGRTPFLVDDDGIIVAHPNPKVLYSSLVPLEQKVLDEIVADQRFRKKQIETVNETVLAQAIRGGREKGNVTYASTIAGREEIAGFASVPGQDWMVVVSQSRDAFTEPLKELFRNVLISVAIVGAAFLVLGVLFARSIVKPIKELEGGVHALKSGDYERAHIPVRSNDEVGRLARTFNVMIDVLRQRERERAGRRRGTADRDPQTSQITIRSQVP